MNCKRISHIGIAVTDLQEAVRFYTDGLGLPATSFETVEDQKAVVAFVPCGQSNLELLESVSPDGPIGRFIEKNGGRGGIHHIAVEVDNIEAALAELGQKGYALIDETPRGGAGGAKIAFLHPKATGGVLLELCEGGHH